MDTAALEDRVKQLHVECSELKRKLNEKEFLFENEVDDLKREIDAQKKTITELTKANKELNRELSESVTGDKYRRLESALEDECQKSEKLVALNDQYVKLYSERSEELQSVLKELATKERQFEETKQSFASMALTMDKYSNIEEELDKAKRYISSLEENKQLHIEEIESLRASLSYFEEVKKRKSLNESYLINMDDLDTSRNVSNCSVKSGPESLAVVIDIRLKEVEKELEDCKNSLKCKNEEIESLRTQMSDKDEIIELNLKRINDLDNKLKVADEAMFQAQSQNLILEDEIQEYKNVLRERDNEIEGFLNKELTWISELQKAKSHISQLEEETRKKDDQISKFEAKEHSLISEIRTLEEVKENHEKKIDELSARDNEVQILIKKYDEELGDLLQRLKEKNEELMKTQQAFNSLKLETKSLIETCKAKEQQIEHLESTEDKLKNDLRRCEAEVGYFIDKQQSAEIEASKLRDELKILENKLEKKNTELKEAYKDVTSFQKKFDERSQHYVDKAVKMEAQLKEYKEKQAVSENTIEHLKSENRTISRQLSATLKKVASLENECKLIEDSFQLERMHKERFKREAERMDAELRELKSQTTLAKSNMTVVMPTTVNVNRTDDAAAFLHAMHNSLPSDTFNGANYSHRIPSGFGSSLSMADEESEFMNPKNLSDLKKGICETNHDHDMSGRLSILQRRNTLMPPHLQSSYPIEMQAISLPHITEDSMRKGRGMNDCKEVVLRNIENRSYRSLDVSKSSHRSNR
ncbi:putative leucine-rich repeat-containing protein-like isoform X2 [Dinothrombium tinctorium]|uniref:Putative leucine-rich repeat-containing protein-like isoform X2 n=1 Tax=Dinothrombium tinctorium TaxID=1965070 RepID=A0A443QFZ9_9ACAR|nr:putative leucine-rich repeat-containing protein-like isoform X2 [Dinothrombium tinctorium]RWS03364.1 putative leucine-rich repeat-containing protein-like isoform X2 [Dinothrombium tinctorium]